ncbi:MAG: hypothetical protein E6767_09915 [Dysgonomonas sp.]|nr:hypothetical protein [Dysgonomonas sp.]
MKDLKKYIEENRDIFDDNEPIAGHFERFEALLDMQEKENQAQKPKRRIRLISAFSVAASIAVLIAVALKFYTLQPVEGGVQIESNVSEEFVTTNQYYNQQMEEQIADIMCKLAQTDEKNQEQLAAEMQKMKERNTAFVEEISKNENQEMAIYYLVRHYKTNIRQLENINEKLGKHAKC